MPGRQKEEERISLSLSEKILVPSYTRGIEENPVVSFGAAMGEIFRW